MENNYFVYKHIFPNGKIYIGITRQKPERRWRKNGIGYKYQQRNSLVWAAIQKYGWENVKHEILFQNLSQKEACRIEIELIKKFNATNSQYGYNLCSGGAYGPEFISEETKKKMSLAKKGRKPVSYKWTEEQKQHLREVRSKQDFSFLKGRKMPENFKKERSNKWAGENNPNFNNQLSKEAKEKRKQSLKGRICWNKGKKMSLESRKKMSEAKKNFVPWNKGVPCSEETKKKISEARKKK